MNLSFTNISRLTVISSNKQTLNGLIRLRYNCILFLCPSMSRFFLVVITFLLLTNINYASFPVVEDVQHEMIYITEENTNTGGVLFAVLSILLSLLSLVFIFLFIGNGFAHNGNPLPYLVLSIVSILATIFSGIEAKRRGLKKSKSFIGIITLIISLLLIRYLLFV